MTLALKRITRLNGQPILPDDYDVIHGDEIVGRIYRINARRELWRWMIRLRVRGPNGGLVDTFEAAETAFRRAWDADR
jgi:hypothetical protein